MDEEAWLACEYPRPMLEFLRGRANDRKLWLFAVACCRRISHSFRDERSRMAVEVVERYADGLATLTDVLEASRTALAAYSDLIRDRRGAIPEGVARAVSTAPQDAFGVADAMRSHVVWAVGDLASQEALGEGRGLRVMRLMRRIFWRFEEERQCGLLRDIFGNPFRPTPIMDPTWLTVEDGTVLSLAQAIYDERAFDQLPILADALEDAGCTDPELLEHLRGPGPHMRGCWALDLVLGRG